MAEFTYKALKPDGSITSGKLEFADRGAAIAKLKEDGLTLLDLVIVDSAVKSTPDFFPSIEFRKIRPQQLAFFFRQLGELVESGLPIVAAIQALQRFCGNEKMRQMLLDLSSRIQSGQGFTEALAAQRGVFSRVQLGILEIGERSGTLDEALRRIADLVEAQLELRAKIRSALSYPFFVLGFSSFLCWALVTFLLPTFEPVWNGANLDISKYPVTVFLMKISVIFRTPIDEFALVALIVGLTLVLRRMISSPEGQDAFGAFLFKLPLLGGYMRIASTAEVSTTVARLLEGGMPILDVLELTADTTDNSLVAKALRQASQSVREGDGLTKAFEQSQIFPELFIQMVSVGETTGEMPTMLLRVAQYYKRQLDDSLKTLTGLVEPLMMVIIGAVVFVFVLGVFMPIMGIVGSLSK